MTLTRQVPKKSLTVREYMRIVRQCIIRIQDVNRREEVFIGELTEKLVNTQAPHKSGDILPLQPRHTPPGREQLMPFTHFHIKKVYPDVDWKDNSLRWKYTGEFSNAESKESGHIYDDDITGNMPEVV